MKRILLTAGILLAIPNSANAISLPCNFAVQNWINGSHDTCPVFGAGAQKQPPRQRRYHMPDDECDARSYCDEGEFEMKSNRKGRAQ